MATIMETILDLEQKCIQAGNNKYGCGTDEAMDLKLDIHQMVSNYIYNPCDVAVELQDLLTELEEA